MHTALAIALMVLVESAAIIWASRTAHDGNLRMISLVNMMLIALFGRALMDIGIGITNIGCISYVSVVCSQSIIMTRSGVEACRRTIGITNWTLIWIFAGMACMDFFPVVTGNEAFRSDMHTISYWTPRIAAGSFAAFFIGQETLWRTWAMLRDRHHPVIAVVLASVACQAVDSPVFFGVAFLGDLAADQIVEAMAVGFLFKAMLTLAFVPAFLLGTLPVNQLALPAAIQSR